MRIKRSYFFLCFFFYLILFNFTISSTCAQGKLLCGADQPERYLPLLQNKKVALVVNQTSMIGNQHLVDFLVSKKVLINKIFAPEHGFRGEAGPGEEVRNSTDQKTGIPIISVYGNNRKPSNGQLSDIELVVFDIQDVGCRFYTYISTLHYIMEACAESAKSLLILDRPNPNGDYIAGPILRSPFRSFVGMDPIPVVHGCTIGELAMMINGEKWLANGVKTQLYVIKVTNYTHLSRYEPPVKPSPNLPDYLSIRLYPSLCFFEATSVSVGRGTQFPFQVLGYPDQNFGKFSFTPQSLTGMDPDPLQKGKQCFGEDLRNLNEAPQFTLSFFLDWYKKFDKKEDFLLRPKWFNQLIGNDKVIRLITEGKGETEIRDSWRKELSAYQSIRKKYLLYPDFKQQE